MKTKTNELTGAALDWAVGIAEGYELNLYGVDPSIRARVPGLGVHAPWAPQKYWSQGGPIIERDGISVAYDVEMSQAEGSEYWATLYAVDSGEGRIYGPTPLIAAMRCYVASKLGDKVEVPDGLL